MAKRVNVKGSYMLQRERTTSAGKRGTFIGKWSPDRSSAQSKNAKKSIKSTVDKHPDTFRWLGGED